VLKNNGFHNRHSPFSRPFSPASFFANGEQGWWYDPSNFATLFQDSAGTTPVTAVEQPVGLQLDLSQGAPATGPELVVNGSFDSSADWILGANVSITGSALVFSSTGSTLGAQQTVSTYNSNSYYKITVVITSLSAGQFRVKVNSGTLVLIPASVGTHTVYVYSGTSVASGFELLAAGTTTGAVDNISVKELPGNHRFQSTSANRPVVSARVNLLTKTEDFANAAWQVASSGGGVNGIKTPNFGVAPDGTTTACRVQLDVSAGSAGAQSQMFQNYSTLAIGSNIPSAWLKTTDGSTKTIMGFTAIGGVPATITVTGTWARIEGSRANSTLTDNFQIIIIKGTTSDTADLLIWHPDVRSSNQGVDLPAYQRVNTSTDYDAVGFPVYIKPNGSNQFMQTNSINFTATDKMTVWQGIRKLSSGVSVPMEFSTNVDTNASAFNLASDAAAANNWYFSSGSIAQGLIYASATTYAAPITNVIAVSYNRAVTGSGQITPRVNALTPTLAFTGTGSTGNFGNYPAYFFARGGTTLFFSGHDYGSIARGAASTAAQIANGETYINSKTKAF
jgi:hypothetical protein